MNAFVLFFALPRLLYRLGATTPIAQLLDPNVALTYLLVTLIMVGFLIAVTPHGRIGWNDAAFVALVVALPNTGFMGVSLDRFALKVLVLVLVFWTFSGAVALMTRGKTARTALMFCRSFPGSSPGSRRSIP